MISTISLELAAASIFLALLSYLTTKSYHYYALTRDILDVPNHRSSHEIPTPRGGGVSIILGFTLATLGLGICDLLNENQVIALLTASLPVAIIGLLDDHKPVSSSIRFAIHISAAIAALLILTEPPSLSAGSLQITIHGIWIIPAAISLTWLTNLYNFMDGIDGIASTEAICFLLGATIVSTATTTNFLPLLFITPIIGFLLLNWAPAKIFMGDAGSGFLGAFLGMLAIILASLDSINLWASIILLATFIADASWTLAARFADGQQWHKPHRSHSYQKLSRKFDSHRQVNYCNIAITLFWLTPLAYIAQRWPQFSPATAIIAYTPLIITAYRLKAGQQT